MVLPLARAAAVSTGLRVLHRPLGGAVVRSHLVRVRVGATLTVRAQARVKVRVGARYVVALGSPNGS